MWLFPFYRWKSSGKQSDMPEASTRCHYRGVGWDLRTKSHPGMSAVQSSRLLNARWDLSWSPSSWFTPLVWFWVVPGVCIYLRELSSPFFAWLEFVTTLKLEEVLSAESLFSLHVFRQLKQAGLCCIEDIHLVSMQDGLAPFSACGCCWSWNVITGAVVGGSNLQRKNV